jgi:hypothetical protein
MDDQPVPSNISSLSEALEKYNHVPGSTPREKIRNAHAQLRASTNIGLRQPVSASVAPSATSDVESAQVSVPEQALPLSVPIENTAAGLSQPAVEGPAAPPLLQEIPTGLGTIQPSALTVSNVDNLPRGSVQLGPSEFALTLPMDSRVKDEYERALADEAGVIRNFSATFSSTTEPTIMDIEVSTGFLEYTFEN